ncbi:MAG: glycosyltransferase family 2 protein [Promethearchaeota archaeon]
MKTLLPSHESNYDSTTEVNKKEQFGDYIFPDQRIGVVIPAYNEEMNIGKTLQRIPKNISNKLEIAVIDDGSIDNTYQIVSKYDVNVIRHSKNRGNGAATKTGINFFRKKNSDVVVILDGDGQHDPKYISKFVEPILTNSCDFVIGNRFTYFYDMNAYRKFCSKLMTALYFLLFRKKVSDPTNGYRALSSRLVNNLTFDSEYSLTQEMLFKIIPYYNYKQIPIILKQRDHGYSFIKMRDYFSKIILLFIKYYIFPKIKWITHRIFSKKFRDRVRIYILKT